ncbi:MAG: aminotransferase class I/II-fold pyridoxal phosphate-dependent enzyme [Chloroflexi bacterium]|jgi:LL-diaminopimelate aminotransferase|nr:aminotransferase class I/II-fold pyridoxal phosphate-dependent enzyme [Anaerolineaceae bacterium]NLI45068.1 aminotransferase class I/II-fold pyridoxal phosphate-dependent enzyme [Chloroflexota bacterium]HOE35822.1 aminotransferase class I/II-fold pyridoxal phosphate-dependent enzyme [Anaerolineaceae bacterium]HOT25099.1 aminotransferase class I/II-fold pyridoxal phosphate-dependent enzyme [Anaerolineaceae bacterium]HQH58064.1 aminotransferase class I/II-fold pyridoxal phosphate-dependent enz
MKIRPAHTVENIKPYFFASLNKTLAELKAKGVNIIRLDMGSPDMPPAQFIIDRLIESARDPKKHGYAPMGGSAEFLKAITDYYKARFGVDLNPKTEVLALLGSKEGIFNINHTLLDPGDLVLMPDPYYPVYLAGAQLADSRVFFMPLLKENNFLPDLNAIPKEIAREAKMMWLNYPNNPTGAIAGLDFYAEAVEFARQNEIVIVHDAPYTDLTFDGYRAHSILEVPGAKDVAIEFNSLSKTYNMAGWRIGMAVGNAEVIRLLASYKSQIDNSIFQPIMDAGALALTGDQTWLAERNLVYQERRDVVYEGLIAAGFEVDKPKAALYLWARLPQRFGDPMQFCADVLNETGVSMTPGVIYGPSGKDYIRISIITPTEQIKEAMNRLVAWVQSN